MATTVEEHDSSPEPSEHGARTSLNVSSPLMPWKHAPDHRLDSLSRPLRATDLSTETGESTLRYRCHRVKGNLSTAGLTLQRVSRGCTPCHLPLTVPFEELLSVRAVETGRLSACCGPQLYKLVIYAVRRKRTKACVWRRRRICLSSPNQEVILEWERKLQAAMEQLPDRPRRLLVILNPYGGSQSARRVWDLTVHPIFQLAGIKCDVIETQHRDHAINIILETAGRQLGTLDGVILVGGDGLFQEAVNGLVQLRARSQKEGPAGQQAAALRLGHIPAGSTDAVAYSIHGTRDVTTAALHIVTGDRLRMDVMRVDTADGHHRFAMCTACYGYMGDLMATSERLRWLGPSRYNLAGAFTLAQGRGYGAKVRYLPAHGNSVLQRQVCYSRCNMCATTGPHEHYAEAEQLLVASQQALASSEECVTVEGRFQAIMAVLMPCRSDRSAQGLAPFGHLADGRLHLVLVKACSRLQFLRFLASIPSQGVEVGKYPYVELMEATAVSVEPVGRESRWNLDGELLENNHLSAQVHRGAMQVFARGVEN